MTVSFLSLLLHSVALLVQLTLIARFVCGDELIVPSNGVDDLVLHFELGQTIQVSWETSLNSLTLLVSHWGGNTVGALLSDQENTGVYTWKIGDSDNIDDDAIKDSPNFVLLIRDPLGQTGNGNGFVNGQVSSRAFVIRNNASSSSSTSSSSISSTSSTSTTFSTTTTSAPISTSSSSVNASSSTSSLSSGLSTSAKGGIGAGAALAGLVLLAVGIWLGVRLSRRAKSETDQQQQQEEENKHSPPPLVHGPYEVDGREQRPVAVSKTDHLSYGSNQHGGTQYSGSTSEMHSSEMTGRTIVGTHEMG